MQIMNLLPNKLQMGISSNSTAEELQIQTPNPKHTHTKVKSKAIYASISCIFTVRILYTFYTAPTHTLLPHSQKVIRRRILHRRPPRLIRGGIKYLKTLPQILVQLQNTRHVATPITVIGRTPHGHQRVVEHAPMSLHDQLMRSRDEIQIVTFVEHGDDIAPEQVSRAAGGETPPVDLLGIAPHEVAHGAVVGNLLLPIDDAYLIEGVYAGTESSVDGEYLILDDGR
mmetsp:Transcript_36140/g.76131  ORF Transcript_36140/g.76131 Transcript_36140/m.76131 type:complete len:227 (+) Transcript_36140:106-786(+)